MTSQQDKPTWFKRPFIWVENHLFQIGMTFAIGAVFLGFYMFFWPECLELPSEMAGKDDNRGDMIAGVVGSLLSFSGILLLVRAIRDQRESIRISQQGLETQTRELEATRRIHHEQQFGAIFFQLLGAYAELLKSFETKTPLGEDVSGKKCLEHIYEHFVRKCRNVNSREEILAKYNELVKEHKLTLKQFNQSLEMVLSFLLKYDPESNILLNQKYAGFISAQLSYHEEFFLLLYLTDNNKFTKAELQELEMFDFDPDPPFEFLSEFNTNTASK